MALYDTHCHLTVEPLASRMDCVIRRARDAGVDDILVPAVDRSSWAAAEALGGLEGIHVALGLHPWSASEGLDVPELREELERLSCLAVGEIGLDWAEGCPPRDVQMGVLEPQLALACDLGLPVILHCRQAFSDLHSVISGFLPGLRGVLHAFSRTPAEADPFLDAGFLLSFGGAVTRPGARRAHASAAFVPPDMMLLETDAPSLGVEGIEPGGTEPMHVALVAGAVARIRGVTPESVAGTTAANARRLFGGR